MVKTKTVIGIAVGIVAAAIFIYTTGPLFFNVTINEEMPEANVSSFIGSFVGVGDGIHDAQGNVILVESNDQNRFLRFENFRATNGPDLFVYLATDESAMDYINLGRLKGNIGNQNYMIPPGVDFTKYNTVLIWCKQFSVLFGSAKLA